MGAGLVLMGNGIKALQQLGLRAKVEAAGVPIERAEIRTWRGELLTAIRVGEIGKRVGAPTIGLHRADLLAALVGSLDAGVLRLDRRCVGVERDKRHVKREGRITLLGDAAHPATPNLGQGACLALEDAVELANCLAAEPDPAAALRTYEAGRRPRTRRIVEQSRRMGAMGQWDKAWACRLRDRLTRITPTPLAVKPIEWIVRHPM